MEQNCREEIEPLLRQMTQHAELTRFTVLSWSPSRYLIAHAGAVRSVYIAHGLRRLFPAEGVAEQVFRQVAHRSVGAARDPAAAQLVGDGRVQCEQFGCAQIRQGRLRWLGHSIGPLATRYRSRRGGAPVRDVPYFASRAAGYSVPFRSC